MEHLEVQKEEKETGRLEAFSDGVFAIATTLLVLDLKDPDAAVTGGSPAQLAKALLRQWPNYIGLVTSYVGAPSRDCAECLQDGCVTSFRQRLPTAWRGVRSHPTSILASYLETPAAKMAQFFTVDRLSSWLFAFFCSFGRHSANRCCPRTLQRNSSARLAITIYFARRHMFLPL
jgi:Endosomal/lysosomal potassium channel TMEM175